MALPTIGINFTAIQNVTPIDFDLKNTSQGILNDIPIKANEVSQGYLGLIVLSTFFTFLIWKFHQQAQEGGDYGYSTARGIGMAGCICSIIGLYALNMGYFTNYFHVVIFIVIAFISVGAVYKSSS